MLTRTIGSAAVFQCTSITEGGSWWSQMPWRCPNCVVVATCWKMYIAAARGRPLRPLRRTMVKRLPPLAWSAVMHRAVGVRSRERGTMKCGCMTLLQGRRGGQPCCFGTQQVQGRCRAGAEQVQGRCRGPAWLPRRCATHTEVAGRQHHL